MDEAHRAIASANHELLAAIAAVETDGSWRNDGATNLTQWLSARYQMSYASARGWVADSAALRDRPDLDEALHNGHVSDDQMHAIVTLTERNPDAAGAWLDALADWPIDSLQREARKAKARKLERRDEGRYLSIEPTPDERFLRVRGQLHPERERC